VNVIETRLPGVLVIEPKVFGDSRGFFFESFQAERYRAHGITQPFVQDNLSLSKKGVVRALHLQNPRPQGKLVSVLKGEVFDVAVDVRRGSPQFGRWFGTELSAENKRQMWVPPGFAHGFVVTSDEALFFYKCTELYIPEAEVGLAWNDPEIGVEWPLPCEPVLSAKDQVLPPLSGVDPERLPVFA
jgi:dTDP-4-dehydrorhamnose 3,5-epimerase